jgi:hypothetical protein
MVAADCRVLGLSPPSIRRTMGLRMGRTLDKFTVKYDPRREFSALEWP